MQFKKYLALFLFVLSTAVMADEKIKIMYVGLPQVGPSVVHAQSFGKNLKVPFTFVSMKDCAASLDYVNNNTDVVYLIASTNAITSKNRGVDCTPKFAPSEIVYIADNYFSICRKPGNTKNIMRDKVTMAGASVLPLDGIVRDFNEQNGTNIVPVPLQSSGEIVTSIINGDVDWGMIVSTVATPQVASGRLECSYSTNPRADNFVGRTFRLTMPDYKIRWLMAVKTSDPAVKAEVVKTAQSKEYNEFLAKLGYINVKTANLEQSDTDRWNKYIDENLKNFFK